MDLEIPGLEEEVEEEVGEEEIIPKEIEEEVELTKVLLGKLTQTVVDTTPVLVAVEPQLGMKISWR